jgi:hypothetical protein
MILFDLNAWNDLKRKFHGFMNDDKLVQEYLFFYNAYHKTQWRLDKDALSELNKIGMTTRLTERGTLEKYLDIFNRDFKYKTLSEPTDAEIEKVASKLYHLEGEYINDYNHIKEIAKAAIKAMREL